MTIRYMEPLSRAWLRMKILLFRPFDIGAWFVLGFTAFLVSLSEGGSSGSSGLQNRFGNDFEGQDLSDLTSGFRDSFSSLMDSASGLWLGLGLGLVMLILIGALFFLLLFLWLSCRGKFMFLDNLVHNRTKISQPWSEYSTQADSLFLWQIVYTLVTLTILGFFVLLGFAVFGPLTVGNVSWVITVPLIMLGGTIAFMYFVAIMYVEYFLTAFVVPIMHKNRCSTMQAWSRFLVLFRVHPGSFVLSGLFYLLFSILGGIALFIGGVMTCCLGLLLMVIPYIGSVVTLPYSVTQRYFTLDFLGQFGDDYRLLDGPQDSPDREPGGDSGKNKVDEPSDNLIEFHDDGTVVGPEDVSEDGSLDEPRPQD